MIRYTLSAMVMNNTMRVSAGLSNTQVSVRRYKDKIQSKNFSLALYMRPCSTVRSLRKRYAHIIGVVVSEMTIDTTMAVERVIANSRNRRPTIPPISSSGIKTAISEMLMENTV